MIDKRFYEHREPDPARSMIGLLLAGLAMFVMACFAGSIVTANELGCPRWLSGVYPETPGHQAPCFASPISGVIWNAEYRWFPTPAQSRNIAAWSAAHRKRVFSAFDASLYAIAIGALCATLFCGLVAIRIFHVAKNYRPMHKGTRFWATDEEVFKTGLAVNYRASLTSRIRGFFRAP